jgi:hypothetical protein
MVVEGLHFVYLFGWELCPGAVSLHPADIIFAPLASPLDGIIFYLHLE